LESKKKTFALRLSSRAYDALERWADDEFRSVNGQIEMLLDRALREAGRLPPTGTADQGDAHPSTPDRGPRIDPNGDA
jgi:hypothetical protein